jgi:hypothetical protein
MKVNGEEVNGEEVNGEATANGEPVSDISNSLPPYEQIFHVSR